MTWTFIIQKTKAKVKSLTFFKVNDLKRQAYEVQGDNVRRTNVKRGAYEVQGDNVM